MSAINHMVNLDCGCFIWERREFDIGGIRYEVMIA